MSAGMVAHIGTRFGGFEEVSYAESTSFTVRNDGCMFNYDVLAPWWPMSALWDIL